MGLWHSCCCCSCCGLLLLLLLLGNYLVTHIYRWTFSTCIKCGCCACATLQPLQLQVAPYLLPATCWLQVLVSWQSTALVTGSSNNSSYNFCLIVSYLFGLWPPNEPLASRRVHLSKVVVGIVAVVVMLILLCSQLAQQQPLLLSLLHVIENYISTA